MSIPPQIRRFLPRRWPGTIDNNPDDSSPVLAQEQPRGASAADVCRIFFTLAHLLNDDLALMVLQLAGFDRYESQTEFDPAVSVINSVVGKLVLCTQPIRIPCRNPRPFIKQITFDVDGKDQGWAGGPGSWTWYTASVVPHSESGNGSSQQRKTRSTVEIARNERACPAVQPHTSVFSRDSDEQEKVDFLDAIQNGDVIEIRAHAQFPGWINHISGAKVSIDTAIM